MFGRKWYSSCSTTLIATALVLVVAAGSQTALAGPSWDGDAADGDWFTAINWDNDTVPTSAANDTPDIDNGDTVTLGSSTSVGETTVGGAIGDSGELLITGGTIDFVATFTDPFDPDPGRLSLGKDGGVGSATISGGTVNIDDRLLVGIDPGGVGSLIISGGTINVDQRFQVGEDTGAVSTVVQTGGDVVVGERLRLFDNATYTISGGSIEVTNNRLAISEGNTGGTLTIDGSGASIINAIDRFEIEENGTLEFIIDGLGVTPVTAGDRVIVEPDDTSLLVDFSSSGLTSAFTLGDILLLDQLDDNTIVDGEVFADAPEGTIVHTFGDGSAYRLTYLFDSGNGFQGLGANNDIALLAVPEPASLVLFGLASLAMVAGRRRT